MKVTFTVELYCTDGNRASKSNWQESQAVLPLEYINRRLQRLAADVADELGHTSHIDVRAARCVASVQSCHESPQHTRRAECGGEGRVMRDDEGSLGDIY